MTKMIRCIEGHVFDIDARDNCPQCGWVPVEKKAKAAAPGSASPFALIGGLFGALVHMVERLLALAGVRDKPGLAPGIVYASLILLFIGALSGLNSAYRGSGETPKAAKVQPEKDLPKTPAAPQQQARPQQQLQPQQQEQPQQLQPQQQPPPPQQQQVAPYPQRPHIHIPGEVRQLLRRIF